MFCITVMSLTQGSDLRFHRATSTHCVRSVPDALRAHMEGRLGRWRPPNGAGPASPPVCYLSIILRVAPDTGECPHAPVDEAMICESFDVGLLGSTLSPLYLANAKLLKEVNHGKGTNS